MPFTLSHPAVVLPFARRKLILSALVIGSMTPDFEYFIFFSDDVNIGHSLFGIFLFCIPVGLIILFLFHKLIKFPALSLLPANLQKRLYPLAVNFHFRPFNRFILIILSIMIGSLTHIAWDSITNSNGLVAQSLPVLNYTFYITSKENISICRLLQHGSTLFGAIVITYYLTKWYKKAPKQIVKSKNFLSEKSKFVLIFSIVSLSLIIAGVYGLYIVEYHPFAGISNFRIFIRKTVVANISVLFVEFIIYSSLWYLMKSYIRSNKKLLHQF